MRDLIGGLLLLVCFLLVLVGFVGLIKPSLTKMRSRKQSTLIGFGGGFAALIAAAIVLPPVPPDNKPKEAPKPQAEQQVAPAPQPQATQPAQPPQAAEPQISPEQAKQIEHDKEPNLGITPKNFQDNYNNMVLQYKGSLALDDAAIKVSDGEVDNIFNKTYENIGMIGRVGKTTGTVKDISILVGGGGSDKMSTPDMMMVIFSAAHAANPNTDKKESTEAIIEIVNKAMKNINNKDAKMIKKTVGSATYSALASPYTGLMISISPKK